jgi:hypothetical protein
LAREAQVHHAQAAVAADSAAEAVEFPALLVEAVAVVEADLVAVVAEEFRALRVVEAADLAVEASVVVAGLPIRKLLQL